MKAATASILIAAAAAITTLPALADNVAEKVASKTIALADGGTLYIFPDGKMAKANRFARAESLQIGTTLQTADGKPVQVKSNEVARLNALLQQDHEG
tara:strand:+ start:1448 stop:1741 length:294 start_codon:yes stop_codon:yes gene_type:complete